VGDIFMRPAAGPGSSYAYLGAEPQRAADGFESIGDLGWFDEDGYLYIADRRLDLILRGGTNIYPAEVELALETHPAVHSAVVIGLPDADLGQRVHALIEPSGEIGEAELRRHAAALLSAHKLPTSYEFIAHPLRDEGGKVRRSQYLQERLGAEVTT
jgi:bile acid-coenzyme A ligase